MLEGELPGIKNEPFYIKVDDIWFNKGCVLKSLNNQEVEVLKVYKNTWWRRLLLWLGFKVRIMEMKVIYINP